MFRLWMHSVSDIIVIYNITLLSDISTCVISTVAKTLKMTKVEISDNKVIA